MADARLQRASHPSRSNLPPHVLNEEYLFNWITHGLTAAGFATDDLRSFVDVPFNPVIHSASTRCFSPSENPKKLCPGTLDTLTILAKLDHLCCSASHPDASTRLDLLDALLARRAPCFENEQTAGPDAHSLPALGCAFLFAQLSDPVSRWSHSWNAIAEQRRRSQHFRATNDAHALAPSLFLIACGIATVDELTDSNAGQNPAARRLWQTLFDALGDCWLTIPFRPINEPIEVYLVSLFERHCSVFAPTLHGALDAPDQIIRSYVATLAKHFAFLGGDDLMITRCCVAVFETGMARSALALLVDNDSGRVAAALDQFERWQELAPPSHQDPNLLHRLHRFRIAIQPSRSP